MKTQNLDRPFKNLTLEELENKLKKCSSSSSQKGRLIDEIELKKTKNYIYETYDCYTFKSEKELLEWLRGRGLEGTDKYLISDAIEMGEIYKIEKK
jgi:hypothetical protein